MHWPTPEKESIAPTWETFGELRAEGLTRSIGVSNFDHRYLPDIIATGLIPAVNQIELHPQFQQKPTKELADVHQILLEAWGPLGQGKVDYQSGVIGDIAQRHGASWAQIVLAWHIARGHIVFPKSSSPQRMAENLASVDVTLSAEDIAAIDALDQGRAGRVASDPANVN
nr:aldo/keto reductase [Arcanobacterium phocisimile]